MTHNGVQCRAEVKTQLLTSLSHRLGMQRGSLSGTFVATAMYVCVSVNRNVFFYTHVCGMFVCSCEDAHVCLQVGVYVSEGVRGQH